MVIIMMIVDDYDGLLLLLIMMMVNMYSNAPHLFKNVPSFNIGAGMVIMFAKGNLYPVNVSTSQKCRCHP